ncbi:hypothetical protein GXP67_20085 [Rhodocytophaga rosea]|uniref:TTHB210-like domain-containing protein n=1 Tax=Rhodocytophaga rosea TaxID=2704465 RepID=A0A6C0GLU8_9BACT|nr:DUF5602 domain-containing protein [Rhodocytophaga rosea]QHT68784.1 hypothetical protein GXP67_20085 [Rhodocytophaga rosea]
MKTNKLFTTVFTFGLITLAATFTACNDDDTTTSQPRDMAYGPEVSVGNGKARSFIKLDNTGNPTSIGFTLSKTALEGLPHEEESYLLALPEETEKTPYNFISLDWASHGHSPEGVYNVPHFDMHFYMIDQSKKAGILHPSDEIERLPDAKFLPPTYFSQPGEGVPQMGKHWVDATSPELQGKPFTATFIYGSYDGEVIFHEPMISHSWLLARPDTIMTIPQPQTFRQGGLYPAKYRVEFDEASQQYIISLLELSAKQASL